MNSKPRSELAMVRIARQRLKASGTTSKIEVPLLGRSIDLVFLKGTDVCSVEFKLKDWKRALRQARDHQLGADLAFICIPERKLSEKMEQAFTESGVGLLFFDPESRHPWKEILPARSSPRTWLPARNGLLASFYPTTNELTDNRNHRETFS